MKSAPEAAEEWIFFDLGSTLVDETVCLECRLRETLTGQPAPVQSGLLQELRRGYSVNRDGYRQAIQAYGLPKAPWRGDREYLYPETAQVLRSLERKYCLGVIANQEKGARERLTTWGIADCFRVLALSWEVGISKPDISIFQYALKQAKCDPERSWMVGDRLDNDILPAMNLGMKTVWLRQGWGAWGNPELLPQKPTHTIEHLGGLLDIF